MKDEQIIALYFARNEDAIGDVRQDLNRSPRRFGPIFRRTFEKSAHFFALNYEFFVNKVDTHTK